MSEVTAVTADEAVALVRRGVPAEGRFLVMCRSGARSARAVELLAEEGHEAVNAEGDILAWAGVGGDAVTEA